MRKKKKKLSTIPILSLSSSQTFTLDIKSRISVSDAESVLPIIKGPEFALRALSLLFAFPSTPISSKVIWLLLFL